MSLPFPEHADRLPEGRPASALARGWERWFRVRAGRRRAAAARELGRMFSITSERIPERIERALVDPVQCWREWTNMDLQRGDYPLLARAAVGLATSEDEVAAVIDWRSGSDEVLAALAPLARRLGREPLWTEIEAASWREAERLSTWQLVDELMRRFKRASFAAFDASSQGDGYEIVFVSARDLSRAAECAELIDLDGDLRPYQECKFG